jgi:hypothetical protein
MNGIGRPFSTFWYTGAGEPRNDGGAVKEVGGVVATESNSLDEPLVSRDEPEPILEIGWIARCSVNIMIALAASDLDSSERGKLS